MVPLSNQTHPAVLADDTNVAVGTEQPAPAAANSVSVVFVSTVLVLTLLCCATVLVINIVVDPLWYFDGNRVTHKNLFFNERDAKINLYLQAPEKYDCIIFGASATTTLDTTGIGPYNCFNFAFSFGTFAEFASYTRYLKSHGTKPRLIIVAVDWPNLIKPVPPAGIPIYIRTLAAPSSFLQPYLSLKVVSHSIAELV